MQSTPRGNKPHISIFGNRNAGKSSLLNAIIGQEIALVSEIKGTTTDPVNKTMELLPFGPVIFFDTAGLDDSGTLGDLRVKSSKKILQRTDFGMYIYDINDVDESAYLEFSKAFKQFNIPHILVFNKIDLVEESVVNSFKEKYPEALFVSTFQMDTIWSLKDVLIKALEKEHEDPPIIGDLVPYGSTIVLVVPIDSEAPKGRIILPQVQVIRDALDHGIKCIVVRDTELEETLESLEKVDLVITDSQAFKSVSKMVPDGIALTSFSIVFARHKGDIWSFKKGIDSLELLTSESKILIAESCTHNHSHEDIGRVKIPKLLNQKLGVELNYTFRMGHDFPEDLETYDMVIHCGSCMLNQKTMLNRIAMCDAVNVPITNYGMVLAFIQGILDEATDMFK